MKIYIIGERRTEEEYEKMESALAEEGNEVLNIARVLKQMPELTRGEREKIAHAMIGIADAVFVGASWKESTEAKDEVLYAISQNINVVFEEKDELPFM